MNTEPRKIDPKKISEETSKFLGDLEKRVIGQDRAIKQLTKSYNQIMSGLAPPNKPISTMLFLGPTGVGKTELSRALAYALLGSRDSLIRIDCAEYQQDHEISKLIGAPPGYLGYSDKRASRLSQSIIDEHQIPEMRLNVLLFDEVEKSSDALYDLLLGVLDAGRATMGNGDTTDFTRSIIIMTSNLGSRDTMNLITDAGIGFHPEEHQQGQRDDLDDKIWKLSKDATKKHFRPEFLNRIDKIITFHSLSAASLRRILSIEISGVQDRILIAGKNVLIEVTDSARDFLLKEGTSEVYGARELKRAIERYITQPMASLFCNGEVKSGEDVKIDYEGGKGLTFYNEGPSKVISPRIPELKIENRQTTDTPDAVKVNAAVNSLEEAVKTLENMIGKKS